MSEPLTQTRTPDAPQPEIAPALPFDEGQLAEPAPPIREGVADPGVDQTVEPPSAEELQGQLERAKQDLSTAKQEAEVEKTRRADTQRDWHQQQRVISYYDSIVQQLQYETQRRDEAERYLQQAKRPEVADPDELLADPQKLLKHLDERDQWMWNMYLASSQPFFQTLAGYEQIIPGLIQGAELEAYQKAEDILLKDPNVPYQKGQLQQYRQYIDRAFQQTAGGGQMRVNPKRIADTFVLMLRQNPTQPVQATPQAPPSAGEGTPPTRKKALPKMDPEYAAMARRLKLKDPGKAWARYQADKSRRGGSQ